MRAKNEYGLMHDHPLRRARTDLTQTGSVDPLFDHAGEMAARMRAIDWAATPLGPVAQWSQALRTMVGVLLRNRFPLLLWWGPEFVQLYNDAYIPIPGAKHPRALAQPAAECWAEIWDVIGPMVRAPFGGEPATWSDDLELFIARKGFAEETHFKVAYSPVPDESVPSGIGGVLATVAEITEEVYARRQLATLRDLAAQASDAKTAEEACAMAARTMEANARDIPCALFYLFDAQSKTARLVSSAGFDRGAAAERPPERVALDDASEWPIGRVMKQRRADVVQLVGRELPRGAWSTAPKSAVILPLASPEQSDAYGVVVAAASPHRDLDEQYRSFFHLAADHVASAIRNARAYQEERERAEKLAEIDRAKTLFFSNVSHEFRTPLTLMLAPIEDMLASPPADAATRERLELLSRNAQRLLKLVNNLLDFSRIEAGRAEATYEPTDLASLTADLASSFRSAIERAGVALVVDCAKLDEPIFVDRAMWEKIVLNLLSNAFKFTFEGSIAVRLRANDGAAELEIADTGTGIASAELPRLFERFHRIEGARSRSHEGSGIGLALVHELVRMHGGEIRVESREGEGTTFRIRVPFGAAHLPSDRVRAARGVTSSAAHARAYVEEALRWGASTDRPPSSVAGAGGVRGRRARIVVADDNADMRDYVARLLDEHWDVEAVNDGNEALAAIRRDPPDLVLSDVMMPGKDGFALLRAVRSDPALASTPFVLLSARAGEEATADGLNAGADDYIVKPFTARELLVRVAARLAAARGARDIDEERKRLYRHFMQAPFAVAVLRGPELAIELANEVALRAWAKGPEVVGVPFRRAVPELEGQPFFDLLEQVYRTGVPHQERGTIARTPTGANGAMVETYWNFAYVPLLDGRGAIDGVMIAAFDVTEQVTAHARIEKARAEAETLAIELAVTSERLLAAQSVGGIGMFDWDVAADRVYWSPELYAFLGLAPGAIAATVEAFDERLVAEDRDRGWRAFREATAARREQYEVELRVFQPNGRTRWGRMSTRIRYDATGAPRRVLGAIVDIEALKQAASARDAERRRLLHMLQQVPAAVNFLRGRDLVFELAHPLTIEAVGGRQLLGRPLLEALPEHRGSTFYERLRRVFETGESSALHEHPVRLGADGAARETYWDSVYLPVRDDAGSVEGVMTFDFDVTESVLARRELEIANRAKDEFLATMSHELRTPLNAMLGWAAILSKEPCDRAKLARGLEVIERNAQTQARLVSDLLDVSRIISGKLRLTLKRTEVSKIVYAAADVVRPAADAKRVRLILDLDPTVGATMADPDRLQQIVWNLLSNAVRFTPSGGRVTATTQREGDSLTIRVRDTGTGIPREHLPHIFERFRQVDSSTTRAHGGLGLGLAIVRHLVEAHGGTVTAASDGTGLGATFTVRLPVHEADASHTEPPPSSDALTPTPPPGQAASSRGRVLCSVRALVVDDDRDSLDLLRAVLEGAGAKVVTATSAREALLARERFDVLISDIAMPEMDGYALIERMRSRETGSRVPAIALTAYARQEDAARAIRAGYQEHIAKPVDAQRLLELVRAWTNATESAQREG